MSLEDQMRLGAEWRARTGFATSREKHAAAERAAQHDDWYTRQAAKPPHPDSTALFMSPEENARTDAAFLLQRAADGR